MAILNFNSPRLTSACVTTSQQQAAIALEQAIENALAMVRYYRTSGTPEGMQAAAKKAFRAAALLDQACVHQTAVGGV